MRALRFITAALCMSLLICSCTSNNSEPVLLTAGWEFKQLDSLRWNPAVVPGSVHESLFSLGIIDDPFFGNNEEGLQWIGEVDWEFKTSFEGRKLFDQDHVELVFEGLDTYADVYLNDSLILKADNMFRTWTIDIKNIIRSSDNHLYIHFFSPGRIEKDKEAESGYRLPEQRGFTRKAPYQYGWDWGPSFITSGLWKDSYIRTWDDFRIENIKTELKELSKSEAKYMALVEVVSDKDIIVDVALKINGGAENKQTENIRLVAGINHVPLSFSIKNPKLWWPNGLGEQHLYELEVSVKTAKVSKNISARIGVREIELIIEPDSIGESFYFLVNGHPVFMKGANYIPQDNFLARVPDQKYKETLQSAVDANMNMLRVWGGGVYERDIFYELCDEMGLLVWQDFMFACNMYPGDDEFLINVSLEAIEQVKRLRNHPCLALWCGNNEISEGWYNWGWQKSLGYSEQDSLEVFNNYKTIFEDILPWVINEYDGSRSYWPSSPSTGWGHEQALYSGDMHYWGVWWGEEPFEVYENKVGRFMSEYGFQGFPNLNTLDSCLEKDDFRRTSANLLNHQKHPRGMELIQMYMERDFPMPDDFENYAYVSQLVQAYGIKIALDAHRRAMPYCMGTLYWQLNDCWPVISWSSVDYYNRWKALHYFARSTFDKVLVSFEEKQSKLDVYIISDYLVDKSNKLNLELMDFNGNIFWSETMEITLKSNTSQVYYSLDLDSLLIDHNKSEVLLNVEVEGAESVNASGIHYFTRVKDLNLPPSDINFFTGADEESLWLSVTSSVLAKNVFLSSKLDGHFTENYFDLLPGDTMKLKFEGPSSKFPLSKSDLENFMSKLKVLSLNDL